MEGCLLVLCVVVVISLTTQISINTSTAKVAEVPNNNFHARCDHTPESSKWFSLQYIDQWSVSGFKYHFKRGWRRAMPCRVKREGEKEFSQNWNFLKCLHCYRKGRLLSIRKICWHNVIVYDDGAACIIPL